MELDVLGVVRIRGEGPERELTGRMQRVLLGMLLIRANQPVSPDELVRAMWGRAARTEVAVQLARKLQLHVHRLRRWLDRPDRLVLAQDGYLLQVGPGELDAERFESLLGEAEELAVHEPDGAVGLVRQAMALWRGDPFSGLDVPALVHEAARLAERRLAGFELLHELELRCGRHAAIVADVADLVRRYPLRERLHGVLMIALYRSGRQAEALEVYRSARSVLVEELGLEPGAELRRIEQRILAGEEIEPASPLPSAPVLASVLPAQLPHDVRGFVGREAELSALDALVDGAPGVGDGPVLISALAGTAGVGKTALAIRWAHRVRARFPDGQLYVDLRGYGPERPVTAHDALAGFLRALGVDGTAIPTEPAERAGRYRTMLNGRRVLVVLDNARTVDQVRPLLPGSSSCFVVVTSRDSLAGLGAREGAHGILLDRLPERDALDLFHELAGDRAAAEPAATATLVERCARLPLALRVAGEQIRTRRGVSVAELVAELNDQQSRLDVLDVDGDRHTAVRAVFSWSYRHLQLAVARLFRLCGLHPGHDLTPSALAALADADPRACGRTLATLARAHLVEEDTQGRFGMHDLMRAYAAERAEAEEPVTERDEAIRRLLTWYLHSAVAARFAVDPRMRRIELGDPPRHVPTFGSVAAGMRWFELERPNLVAVVRHAAEVGEHSLAWQLTTALLTFFHRGKHWDDWIGTHRIGLASARTAGDLAGQGHVLNGLGVAYSDLGRSAEAIVAHREAAELYRRTDSRSGEAWNLNNLGVAYDDVGRFAEAIECYQAALRLFQELGDPRGQGLALCNLGDVLRQRREPDRAIEALRQAMAVQQAAGDLDGRRFTLANMGDLHREAGNVQEAVDSYQAALAIGRDLGDRWQVARLLERLAEVLNTVGETVLAAAHAREARMMFAGLRAHPQAREYLRRAGESTVED